MPNSNVSPQDRLKIDAYIISNSIDRTKKNPYDKIAKEFNVSTEYVRNRYRALVRKGNITSTAPAEAPESISRPETMPDEQWQEGYRKFKRTESGAADLTFVTGRRIQTEEDIIEVANIDLTKWKIAGCEVTSWEVGRKNKAVDLVWETGAPKGFVVDKGGMLLQTLWRVNVKLSPRKLDSDLGLQKEALMAELRGYSPIVENIHNYKSDHKSCLLELCTHDLHIGGLSWKEEAGEDYDLKIAETRFKESVNELLKRTNLDSVEKILFPIGNDLFNVDNKKNTTINGTVVDTDARFIKMIKVARKIVIEVIDQLSLIAPVDVLIVPGNHDETVSFMLGEILDAFYFHNQRVNIDNSPKARKYYQYGNVSLQLTHGDQESHGALGLIFATEEPKIWANTKYRFCQLGHFHKNKKIEYLSVDEHQGFQIQILPTLSSCSVWAYKKGYNSVKQAKAFLFDKEKGLIAEYTHSI